MSNKRTFISTLLISVLLLVLAVGSGQAQGPEPQGNVGIQAALGTAFTYQGRLTDGGNPANGTYDFQFKLYDAASGGAQVGNTLEIGDVPVSEGLFTVLLDFGSGAFDGNARWLEIGVRPGNSSGAYTTLSPRQALTAAPYALYAKGAPWSGLTDVPAGFADGVDNDTTYTAGVGLSLNGTQFNVTGAPWSGLTDVPAGFADGVDNDTTYTAGTGLSLNGTQFNVTGAPWSGLTGVPAGFADGVDNDTTYTAGTGLDLSGGAFSIRPTYRLPQGCANGQIAKWNGSSSSWECGNEQGGLTLPYSGSTSASGAAFQVVHTANTGTNYGVYGKSNSPSGRGVYGEAPTYGVYGFASASSGTNYGVYGETNSPSGRGVYGFAAGSGTNYGVYGETNSPSGRGVYGEAPNYGVYGLANSQNGFNFGVYGKSNSTFGHGVYGKAPTYGVYGLASNSSGITYGVYGKSISDSGRGVYGEATATSGTTYGVYGESRSPSGRGVYGYASATTGTTYGVYGASISPSGYGVVGEAPKFGVYGEATATSGFNYGVYGKSISSSGYAGYFYGKVHVTGNLSAGGTKPFKIDHPLDPANRYLYHFAQEGPEVQNVYNGVVTLDANGEAVVTLPAYFGALNAGPYRYQLTPIGAPMPDLYIAQEIQGHTFRIAGGVPGKKVSWEVTAVRNDPYLRDHPAQAEVDKPAEEQGTYLYPEGYGQPKEMGLDYQPNADLFEQVLETDPPSAGDSK